MFGDHSVGGNTKKLTMTESFVSMQCFMDVQISSHFVVLLISHFRDTYNTCQCPCTSLVLMHVKFFLVRLGACVEWSGLMTFRSY